MAGKERVQVKIDLELKTEAESILKALGMNPTTAITVFYRQVVETGGLPFELKLSEETLKNQSIENAQEPDTSDSK